MGVKTPNDIFYKPAIAASGAVEKGKYDDGLDIADGLIEANKPVNNKLSAFAATTSAELAGVITDEEGSGKVVLNDSPVFTTKITTPIIDLTGGQIKFPAIVNPSAGVNTLDDYEEGEWTPELKFGGLNVDMNYSSHVGLYQKIGKQVTVTGYLVLTAKGTSIGSATIEGLPFKCINISGAYGILNYYIRYISFLDYMEAYISSNGDIIVLNEVTNAGATTAISSSDFADNSMIRMNMVYFTD